ncbi:substrate-binding domain-containing protein [Niveibacterium umoris]|uniref:Ribose transport system substrate-binding protein n=1 Tax=Niveibacterium umoris TaxID=1193620 RepID=A0A840BK19_9RHOO|nr:substrate-binding domain-containing protein [Niveibacterium umoris]MBB4011246.1 ribose transport system substrate-binding protein [Niveibacterium umoris]
MQRREFLASAALATIFSTSKAMAAADRPTIALVLKSLKNEFFMLMADGAQRHASAHASRYALDVQGVQEETDVAGQTLIIKKLINARVSALLVVPADSAAMLPVLLEAIAAGILVINLDNKLDDRALVTAGVSIPFVGPSNFAGARAVGDYVARKLQAGSKVGIIEGPPGSINAKARSDGFREAMQGAGMLVAGVRSGYWEVARGSAAANELIKAVPDVTALLCGNDNMAIGAASAVDQAHKRGRILVAGYDNIPAIRPLLQDGRILVTADQFPARQAEYGLNLALEALQTHKQQRDLPTIVQTPVSVVAR